MSSKALVLLVVVAMVAGACTRSGSPSSTVTPLQVYSAGPPTTQVQALLGSDLWWPGTPTFGVRPLDLAQTPETVRFTITQHFTHLGTPEIFNIQYVSFSSTSNATTEINNIQSAIGTGAITSPKVGDQVLYTGQRLSTNTALYDTTTFVRLGSMLIGAELGQVSGFPSVNTLARIATALVNRLKNVLAKKVNPTPVTTGQLGLLPPAGTDITMVGVAQLPIEAAADMFGASAPQPFVKTFQDFGITNFIYGDFALDTDFHMEVRTATFAFSSATDASAWIDETIGKSNLDQFGQVRSYIDQVGKYYGVLLAGSRVGLVICGSTAATEAASRACEMPLERVMSGWSTELQSQ